MSLARRTALLYSLPALPVAALGLPLYLQLPSLYAEHSALAATGFALLAARLVDFGGDAAAGWLSDRWPSQGWRRRGPMLIGAAIVTPSAWFLLNPPAEAGALYLFCWAALAYSGWSLLAVPYTAWASELGADRVQRRQLSTLREGAQLVGMLLALGLLAALPAHPDYLLALVLLVPLAVLPLAESRIASEQATTGWRELLRADQPRRLLLAYAVNACANALPATLFLLYVEHRLGAPDFAGTLLLTYFIFGIAALPLWLWLAGRIGAARSWRISLYVACAGFVPAMFLGAGDVWLFVAVCAATGACLGADLALPASLQAEVAHRHGHAGALFAAWGMASKLALALAAGVALPLLSLSGFEARANDDTLPLALLYAAAPIPIKLIAARLIGALVEEENHASTQSNSAAASRDAARERV